ncbi:MAG: NAD(P)/FAD-dependent oxidoreductase [Prochlorococcus sp.]
MVLVAGAGPAGARLAERLALQGLQVTLVETLRDPAKVAFSSAAIPYGALADLDVPRRAVAAIWRGWQLHDPEGGEHQWWSETDLGAVLDFGVLRQQLWQRAVEAGVEFLKGWQVMSVTAGSGRADVLLRSAAGCVQTRTAAWVIDATGQRRCLLGSPKARGSRQIKPLLEGVGVEWIIQGQSSDVAPWGDRLSFFLGSSWIPHGYGWIFPMAANRLKVGVCRLPPQAEGVHLPSASSFLKGILSRFGLDRLPVLDRHGGLLSSTLDRREIHGQGRLIGVGDAVSTANLLGGEGIRSALLSAEILAPLLAEACDRNLAGRSDQLERRLISSYEKKLRQRLGWRWGVSARLARRTWWGLANNQADQRMSRLISGLSEKASAEDLNSLLFDYRFERYGLRLLPYLIGWR